jgi:NAD dependent epimerase/dehydratase family enzyme
LRLLFGEIADVALINGQRVLPKRALEAGFRFDHPTIEDAMMDALSRKA